jgi:DnaJ-class molecular chaperone
MRPPKPLFGPGSNYQRSGGVETILNQRRRQKESARRLNLIYKGICPECSGSGTKWFFNCSACGGTGRVR